MKLAVLGATGRTGEHIVTQSLNRGHHVIAVVRNPSKISAKHENLQVVEADPKSSESLVPAFEGCDVVLSALGGDKSRNYVTLYSDTCRAIVTAMRANNIKRLMAVTAWCTKSEPGNPFFIEWFVKPLFIGHVLADMARMEDYMNSECQDIQFTSVRPAGLGIGPVTDKPILTIEGQWVPEAQRKIERADLARFMLDITESGQWSNKAVAIGVA